MSESVEEKSDDDDVREIVERMEVLTNDQRFEIMASFCQGCGSIDVGCQCWNDE